jgi:hypothetical protein
VVTLGNGTVAQLALHAISHASHAAAPDNAAAEAYQIVLRSADVAVLAAAHAGMLWRLNERSGQVLADMLLRQAFTSHRVTWPAWGLPEFEEAVA